MGIYSIGDTVVIPQWEEKAAVRLQSYTYCHFHEIETIKSTLLNTTSSKKYLENI